MTAAMAPTTFNVSNPARAERHGALNLLIVDDERPVREACREIAMTLGYQATAAESAEQALRLADAQLVDVIFLDLKLPGTSGMEAMRQIKARRPEIEVVVMTGHGTVESAVQAMKTGPMTTSPNPSACRN